MSSRVSAGILLFRRGAKGLEVLLAHPGGPYFATRDEGSWSIPKGEVEPDRPDEPLEAVARREFAEETGTTLADVVLMPLGEIRQKGGKLVHAWAIEGDLDPATATSNTFAMEWPPASGRTIEVPEIDRVEWFGPDEARARVKDTQRPFIDRLEVILSSGGPDAVRGMGDGAGLADGSGLEVYDDAR